MEEQQSMRQNINNSINSDLIKQNQNGFQNQAQDFQTMQQQMFQMQMMQPQQFQQLNMQVQPENQQQNTYNTMYPQNQNQFQQFSIPCQQQQQFLQQQQQFPSQFPNFTQNNNQNNNIMLNNQINMFNNGQNSQNQSFFSGQQNQLGMNNFSNFSPQQLFQQGNQNQSNKDFQNQNQANSANSQKQVTTKVLLVCIYNKNGTLVTHDILYRHFSKYGEVQKILIFQKDKTWKAFIELENQEQAKKCKENLDNYQIFEDGSNMIVYPSNMKELTFQNGNSGGLDYTVLKQQLSEKNASYSNSLKANSNYDPYELEDSIHNKEDTKEYLQFLKSDGNTSNLQDFEELNANLFGDLNLTKTGKFKAESAPTNYRQIIQKNKNSIASQYLNNLTLEKPVPKTQKKKNSLFSNQSNQFSSYLENSDQITQSSSYFKNELNTKEFKFNLDQEFDKMNLQEQTAENFKNNIYQQEINDSNQNELDYYQHFSNSDDDDFSQKFENTVNQISKQLEQKKMGIIQSNEELSDKLSFASSIDPSKYVNPKFIIENKKSKVVYVRGLENLNITLQNIYNLFSNFGNIKTIIFLRVKKSCLIEYQNQEYANNAKDFLNNKNFMGNLIRIFYSNYEELNLKQNEKLWQKDDILQPTEDQYRFKQGKNMSINPPSQTLHFSNLKKEGCNEINLIKFLEGFGQIEGIKLLVKQNFKNMALIKMKNVEQATNIVSQLHGKDFYGRKVQISFTHSKI
ncbi:hypothetical protein PPERSA_05894 [Pseudocohnilembus persalinus]|uniref:RRM domain-containing protein n=1 Tax=Pseudocohnilembus persalinus TaxID=266149 RepID=A0A0V0R407_PSEPJ|nr:hypothetical protein PPERSA_05894 [Pseudocohnilembus persalinus]|eukprot:KRX09225.1 hypothetical protein PPERSA_05894 [Pseudocohnilembus persalinus]